MGQLKSGSPCTWANSLRENVNIKGSGTSGPKGKRTNFFKVAEGRLSLNKIGDNIIHSTDMLCVECMMKGRKKWEYNRI